MTQIFIRYGPSDWNWICGGEAGWWRPVNIGWNRRHKWLYVAVRVRGKWYRRILT